MNLKVMNHHENTSHQPINIPVLQKYYGAVYIGDFCLKTKSGGWSDMPVAVFYQPNPKTELGHTHYFGLFVMGDDNDTLMITNAESAFSEPIVGIIADDGEVIFSRYRHDYHTSRDGSVFVDGGRDYVRFSGGQQRVVKLVIDKDKLVIDPTSIDPIYKIPAKPTRCTLHP